MTLNWTYTNAMTATAVAAYVVLCPVAVLAQSGNPWNPYPVTQARPAAELVAPMVPTAKPKYYQEQPAASAQALPPSPSRYAPADLDQRLSTAPRRVQNRPPYGYQPPVMTPYSNLQNSPNSPVYFGQPQGYANGYPQGYSPMNAPPNLGGYGGGYGPPIIGNNSWGSGPGNNFFPFGF